MINPKQLPSDELLAEAHRFTRPSEDRERYRLIRAANVLREISKLNASWARRDLNDVGMWRL
jgi:hypothetical protein